MCTVVPGVCVCFLGGWVLFCGMCLCSVLHMSGSGGIVVLVWSGKGFHVCIKSVL